MRPSLGKSRWQFLQVENGFVWLEIWFGSTFPGWFIRLIINFEQQLRLHKLQECYKVNLTKKNFEELLKLLFNYFRFAVFFQPMFAICWFIGVVALENIESYAFPTVFTILYNILVSQKFVWIFKFKLLVFFKKNPFNF